MFERLPRSAAALAALLLAFPGCTPSSGSDAGLPDRSWPTYGGDYANTRHIDLGQITPSNVGLLRLAWKFNAGVAGSFETSPIVVDGVMYFTTGPDNGVFALDAATGALKWRYVPKLGRAPYIFNVNRGVAVAAGKVFFTTLDDRLIALDARSGKPEWETSVGDPRTGLREDAAPLAWNGMVFVGSAGNELGTRGSYSAYRQSDGKPLWRWWAVSAGWEGTFATAVRGFALHRDVARERAAVAAHRDAWKTGGGSIWMTPALDPQSATIYLSTGNPAPAFNAGARPGDNLYTDSIVALDARTGKMRWYYQETPHDVWDYDASSPPVLFDALDGSGRRIPVVAEAGKTGWLYIVDRRTGRLVRVSSPFVPQPNVYHPLSANGEPIQPGDLGGALGSIAVDAQRHTAFVAGNVQPETGVTFALPARPPGTGDQWTGGNMSEVPSVAGTARLTAIDTDSGRVRWSSVVPNLVFGGPLSVDGVVFLGEEAEGTFRAYDAATGQVLWQATGGDTPLAAFDLRDRVQHVISTVDLTTRRWWHGMRHDTDFSLEDIHAPAIGYRLHGHAFIAVGSNVYVRTTRAGGNTIFVYALP
jgi:PQQ-dependent dehydrogenase (methanol/ethanol family)